jgi:hypothetical protein
MLSKEEKKAIKNVAFRKYRPYMEIFNYFRWKTDLEFMPRDVLRLEFESSARCWSVVAFYSLSTAFVFL